MDPNPPRDAALAAAVKYSDDAVVHTTVEGEIEFWSEGAERMFGYTTAEARGRSIRMLYPAESWCGRRAYAASFSRDARQSEARLTAKCGREITAIVTAFEVAAGRDGRALGTIYRDVSEQRRIERRLHYKDALANLLQTLIDVANEAETAETALAEGLRLICRHHGWVLGHAVVFAPYARIPALALWHTEQDVRFAPFVELSRRFDYARACPEFLGLVLASREPAWVSDFSVVAPSPRVSALVCAGVRSGFGFPVVVGGEVIGALEFFSDERRAPDALLLESIGRVARSFARAIERQRAFDEKACLAAIVEGASDAIVARSLDGVITSWNPAAERLLGYTAEEALGRSITMTLSPDRHFLVDANNERLRRGELIERQETPRLRKDGTIVHADANVSPVRDRSGAVIGAAVILRDISDTVENRRMLVRKVQLTGLMQTLTRTANEAATPDDALHSCLKLIAEYGRWDAARLVRFEPSGGRTVSALASHGSSGAADADSEWLYASGEPLVPSLLESHDALWIEESDLPAGLARSRGVKCALVFPVVANGAALALLEFYATAARERDTLLVDSVPTIASQLARIIERHGFAAEVAKSEQRLRAILDSEPACVKLVGADGALIEMNRAGLEFLEADSIDEVRSCGFIEVVVPEHRQRFRDSMQRTIAGERCNLEFEIVGLKGTRRWVESHTAPFAAHAGAPAAMLAVTRDITDRKRAEARVDYFAQHDALTALPNRTLFQDRVRVAIAHAKRRSEPVGVMIVALDRFRKVNESFGYDVGDELLRQVAARITSTLREVDTLARLGADQFAVLIEGGRSLRDLGGVADKIHAALAVPIPAAGQALYVTASTGIASYPAHAADSHALLEAAERAMNMVKEEGGSAYLTSKGPRGASAGEYGIEAALRNAMALGELAVHYQPKIDLRTGAITGAEALLRWTSRDLGPVSPERFIPIAEESGLIVPIGEWVLETACAEAAAWQREGHPLHVAVNLSPRQFRQGDLPATVARVLCETGLPPQCLELEITESTAMANPMKAAHIMTELHAIGVRLSVDDFGTGYSSLSYLREFPLDCLKIDRSFVSDICTSASGDAIVRATIALAHSLQLEVVAEGVETIEQHQRLTSLGCDEGQGFLYGAAMPAVRFQGVLSSGEPLLPELARRG
jgi:diguanylate cyclase (GGDEF)-like protein/PAS domain S-box-containing protein